MNSFTTNRIIFAIGAAVLGIILLIWPSTSLIILAKCIGAAVAVGGLIAAYQFYRDHDETWKTLMLVMAGVMIICGVVIFLHPEELVKLIPMIMGILVLISGIIKLGETFTLSKRRYNRWWLSLIIAILTIGAGIFLVKKAFDLAALITRIAGGIFLFDGLSDLWVVSRVYKANQDAQVVDVKAEEVQPETASNQTEGPVAPEQPAVKPEATAAPEQPTVQPEATKAAPAPETIKPESPIAPEQTAVKPETTAAPEQPTVKPEAPTASEQPTAPAEPYKPDLTFGDEK